MSKFYADLSFSSDWRSIVGSSLESITLHDVKPCSTLMLFGTCDASTDAGLTVEGFSKVDDVIDTTDCQRFFVFCREGASGGDTTVSVEWTGPAAARGLCILECEDGVIRDLQDMVGFGDQFGPWSRSVPRLLSRLARSRGANDGFRAFWGEVEDSITHSGANAVRCISGCEIPPGGRSVCEDCWRTFNELTATVGSAEAVADDHKREIYDAAFQEGVAAGYRMALRDVGLEHDSTN
jgi:hypothetical protein